MRSNQANQKQLKSLVSSSEINDHCIKCGDLVDIKKITLSLGTCSACTKQKISVLKKLLAAADLNGDN